MRIVFANVTAVVSWHGECVALGIDQPWDAADPFVRERPECFSMVPSYVYHTSEHVPGAVTSAPSRRGNRG